MRGLFRLGRKVPDGVFHSECEAFFGQDRNPRRYLAVQMRGGRQSGPKSWQKLLIRMRGVRRSEPEFLAVFFQFEREVLFGQNRNSWRYLPV